MKIDELFRLKERHNEIAEYIRCLNTFDESHIKIAIEYEENTRCNIPLPRTIASNVRSLVLNEYFKERKDIENKMDIFLKRINNH